MTTNRRKKQSVMVDSPSYIGDVREGLEMAMTAGRMELLRLIVQELMIVLAKRDFRLDDLLEALTEYAECRSDWSRVAEHLAAAAHAVVDARRELTGGK